MWKVVIAYKQKIHTWTPTSKNGPFGQHCQRPHPVEKYQQCHHIIKSDAWMKEAEYLFQRRFILLEYTFGLAFLSLLEQAVFWKEKRICVSLLIAWDLGRKKEASFFQSLPLFNKNTSVLISPSLCCTMFFFIITRWALPNISKKSSVVTSDTYYLYTPLLIIDSSESAKYLHSSWNILSMPTL